MSAEGAALRRSAPPAGPFGRGPMAGFGMPVQKARDFKGTLRRLAGYVAPHRVSIAVVLAAGVLSTVFSVLGPKLIGMATTTIFEGYLARRLGGGIDWNALGGIVRTLLVLYVTSALFQYLQQYVMSGVAQRTFYALRQDVEAKFSRLPLRFFDLKTHGEILSRAVNDLDNISSTLQQNLTQLITSVLSVIGIIIMMLTISVVLTLVVVLTLPVSVLVVTRIARRSQGFFVRQQQALGELNGHVAEMYSGHAIVSAFGHEARAIARFGELNEKYYDSAWRAQFVTGIMFPVTMFVGNLGYVAVAVMGGFLVTRRAIVHDANLTVEQHRQHRSAHDCLGRTRVRAARRGGRACRLAAGRDPGATRSGPLRGRRVPLQAGGAAHRGAEPHRHPGTDDRHRRTHRRGQDDAGQPDDAVLRRELRSDPG